jgi:hypothetical protein
MAPLSVRSHKIFDDFLLFEQIFYDILDNVTSIVENLSEVYGKVTPKQVKQYYQTHHPTSCQIYRHSDRIYMDLRYSDYLVFYLR